MGTSRYQGDKTLNIPAGASSDSDRDRDHAGRPKNTRARDDLGRPLPRGAHGVDPIDETKLRGPTETLQEAQHLLRIAYPFQAHEVLELRWKRCPEAERELWQALAQLAVGVTHALRGNISGAQALLDRANAGLSTYEGPVPEGLDVARVVQWLDTATEQVARTSAAAPEWLDTATAELERDPALAREWLTDHPPPLT